jgi:hypothetical protein
MMANFFSGCLPISLLSKLVFPAPKKPVMIVTGIRSCSMFYSVIGETSPKIEK